MLSKATDLYLESLQIKKAVFHEESAFFICGPAWAWTRDLQIMSRRQLIFSNLLFISFQAHTPWFSSLKITFPFQIISLVFFYFLKMRANCVQLDLHGTCILGYVNNRKFASCIIYSLHKFSTFLLCHFLSAISVI